MESRPVYILTAVQIVAVVAVLWIVFSIRGAWDLQRVIGTALMLVGVGGIATARYYLGKSFAIKPEAHQLVTRGIYSKIRNPIYVFGIVMLAGFVLVLHRPMLWLLVVAVIIMQTVRARREAKVLEAAFGDAYREYRRKTWF
ncbi:MAG: isoprenylcysteine carboxylmethyltransferase family protein [Candidatus Sulfotelmatobacter sp.]